MKAQTIYQTYEGKWEVVNCIARIVDGWVTLRHTDGSLHIDFRLNEAITAGRNASWKMLRPFLGFKLINK